MNLDSNKKSLFYGVFIGIISTLFFLFLFDNIETEIIINTGNDIQEQLEQDININIEKTIKNGKEFIDVLVYASGDLSGKDIDEELERIYEKYDINKNNQNLNIKININN